MKEFEWFEWFEWFGPSPIETFNSDLEKVHEVLALEQPLRLGLDEVREHGVGDVREPEALLVEGAREQHLLKVS